ncbi:hypothetical protein [Paenibacillus prosopidis]|uniref:Uncharacterized protein n=1 Tax=Paenibacillus prosopidis TaxID=630520 RepID=A0A368VT85_9BACL|nr:hypothetical protein [Paenibacillus prosopidis]RCW44261.1 hypothetical protein DFP97_112125 [Paenibacillus prosopidis]
MIFKKGDKRLLTSPLTIRSSYSIGTIPAGEIIEIQQVNESNRQVLVDNVWMHQSRIYECSIPVEED